VLNAFSFLCLREHCSPDGKKKAYVRLTADHDALDVANKVRRAVCLIVRDMLTHALY
jgi:hypothetical protein